MVKKIGYKFRIYPTSEQTVFLEKHFGCCRFIYNYLLNLKEVMYKEFKINVSGFALKKKIAELKKQKEYKWLKEVNSQSLQESALDLMKAYIRFFKKLGDRPRFKKKSGKQQAKIPQSFTLKKTKRGNCFLSIPKLKREIKINVHREIVGEIKQVTLSKSPGGKYYASLNCQVAEEKDFEPKSKDIREIGVDLGLTSFIVTSSGDKIEAPRFLRKSEKKLKRAQKTLFRKKRYSFNRSKAKKRVAVLHDKVANQRKDFLHKTSCELVGKNQVIYLEDLNVKGMSKNRHLSKSIADAGWGEFVRQLIYKATWNFKKVVRIGRFEPSSKLCSNCSLINKDLKLQDRNWKCQSCSIVHDRDINAAKNILKIGQGMSESKPVEKATAVFSFKRKQVVSVKQEPVSKFC